MNMQGLRDLAKQRGIAPGKLGKIELVRKLQRTEGNFDCFARAYAGYCNQFACLWRDDCLPLSIRQVKRN